MKTFVSFLFLLTLSYPSHAKETKPAASSLDISSLMQVKLNKTKEKEHVQKIEKEVSKDIKKVKPSAVDYSGNYKPLTADDPEQIQNHPPFAIRASSKK